MSAIGASQGVIALEFLGVSFCQRMRMGAVIRPEPMHSLHAHSMGSVSTSAASGRSGP
ncbi:MAG: hypothetical protein JNK05_38065 [Myxococcales bacterium]|nr:hypothetical protein [Myxococcales bacterium]